MSASAGTASVLRGFIAMAVFGLALSLTLLMVVFWDAHGARSSRSSSAPGGAAYSQGDEVTSGSARTAQAVFDGDLHVADAFNRRVQKFSADGVLVGVWTGITGGNSALRYSSALAVDPGGRVTVGDFFTGRLWTLACR